LSYVVNNFVFKKIYNKRQTTNNLIRLFDRTHLLDKYLSRT